MRENRTHGSMWRGEAPRGQSASPRGTLTPPPDPVTSDGSAIVRLKRALANERCSAMQIRALAAELPGPVGLEDALAILLALLEREPNTFSRAAARAGAAAWCWSESSPLGTRSSLSPRLRCCREPTLAPVLRR